VVALPCLYPLLPGLGSLPLPLLVPFCPSLVQPAPFVMMCFPRRRRALSFPRHSPNILSAGPEFGTALALVVWDTRGWLSRDDVLAPLAKASSLCAAIGTSLELVVSIGRPVNGETTFPPSGLGGGGLRSVDSSNHPDGDGGGGCKGKR
jgi:hypothetical protein